MRRMLLSLLILALSAPLAVAQVDGPHPELGFGVGRPWLDDAPGMKDRALYSWWAGWYPMAGWGVEANVDYVNSYEAATLGGSRDLLQVGARGVANLIPTGRSSPYLLGGLGLLRYDIDGEKRHGLGGQLGVGLRTHLTRLVSLRLEARGIFGRVDGVSMENLALTAGISVLLGRDADADRDGVSDSRDRCPETPVGAEVDARGCPFDDDLDGVPRGLDQCPDTPPHTEVDEQGCPRAPTRRRGG